MQAGPRLAALASHFERPQTYNQQAVHLMASECAEPRWKRVIDEALNEDKSAIVYQFATIGDVGGTFSSPRVRSVGHRGFLESRGAAHPVMVTTTDIRSPKAGQLAENSHIELAWWFPKAVSQIRVLGNAYIYPSPDFQLTGADSIPEEQKREIENAVSKLRSGFPGKELAGENFDWEKERSERFDAVTGYIRASWLRPVPGSPLLEPNDAKKWPRTLPKIGEAGDNSDLVEAALKNFALVLIDPMEVDYVELGVVPNRRTRFFKEDGGWKEEALVP